MEPAADSLLPADAVPVEERQTVRCRYCRRPLRDPASRALGRGPGCRHQDPARRYDVEQEALPGL